MEKKLGRGLGRLFSGFEEAEPKIEPVLENVLPARPENIIPIPDPVAIPASKAVENVPAPIIPEVKPESAGAVSDVSGTVQTIRSDQIIPNRFQPRKVFDRASLVDLMESIKSAGVLQPILVRKSGNYYEIVAGERRWRACLELKIASIPVIIKDVDDQKMLEWALIENTQRKDLNPIERARAYKELMSFFSLTQEEIAGRVGLDRATIANFIRLLDLPSEVQDELAKEAITTTHARGLLAINDAALQIKLCQRIKKEGMSVRRLEYIIRWIKSRRDRIKGSIDQFVGSSVPHIREIEEALMSKFNTKVGIYTPDNKNGKIMISFYSLDDFQRILEKLNQVN